MTGVHMTAAQMAQMQTQEGSGGWFILLLVLVQLFIGLAVFLPKLVRYFAIGLGIALSLAFWVVGQSLGGYYTGLATDPSTSPLFILLGISILGYSGLNKKLSSVFDRIEKIVA
jgi:hypothetical protein